MAPAKAFVEAIGPKLKAISKTLNAEPHVNGSIFRLNRDVRFSKDKSPYKTTLDLWFWEGSERSWETPGYFLRLMPKTFIAGICGDMRGDFPPRRADPKLAAQACGESLMSHASDSKIARRGATRNGRFLTW